MKLRGIDGTQFELEVVGYEFPEMDPDPHEFDANWLNIRLSVRSPDRSWTAIEPCLETWEVGDLAQWFESIAAGHGVACDACFTEATVRFALLEDYPTKMRVYFWPGWTPRDEAITDDEDVFIECDACAEALHTAAASLRAQLEKFPIRRADESWNS